MKLKTNAKGFTLVELLIVIVVIAILAAISIVAYNGIQDRARNTTAKEAASQVRTKAEAYHATEVGVYPADKSGFENDEVSKLGTDLASKVADAGPGVEPTQAVPVVYKKCTSDGAVITYWQKGTPTTDNKFSLGDTSTCS